MPNERENRGGLLGWVERRYHVTPLFEFLRHKEVPLGSHWMGWYYLGGVTMFFFIGTGKQVKELVANDARGPEFVKRTRQFKAKTFPPMLWAMIFTMATMIVGGGVHTQVLPSLHLGAIHGVLATIALYYNLVATWRNAKYMIEHNMLMEEVEKRLVASPASK